MTTPRREREEWDAKAPDLETARREIWNTDDPPESKRVALLMDLIAPALDRVARQTGARILDLGCGVGDLTRAMARRYPRAAFIGVDISQRMLDLARAQAKGPGQIRFLLGDGWTLPRVGTLNGAWSTIVFQHIPPDAQRGYIREIAERLEPGGVFRFQFVDDLAAYAETLARACVDAGLRVDALDPGRIFPTWRWITAVRP